MKNLLFRPELTKAERKLIRKIAKLQLSSLTEILTNRMPGVDIEDHCLTNGICATALRQSVHRSYDQFARLLEEPQAFFNLEPDNLSISRALLMDQLYRVKGRRKLWRKLSLVTDFTFHLN
jgi:hypothetical protein